MPTYLYQTISDRPNAPVRRFELSQPISDPPLEVDPETGEPVERVITGGRGPLTSHSGGHEPTVGACGCCGTG